MAKSDVTYDLETSPHVFKEGEMNLYFSSSYNLKRFTQQIDNYIEIENKKLQARLTTRTEFGLPLILALYKRIEKRGFFVTVNGYAVEKDYAFSLVFSAGSLDYCHGN